MNSVNDVYKKLLKEYPDWKIEFDKYDIITLEKNSFYIYAAEDKVGINKKYNKLMCLDDHRHPDSLENMYNDIVYYITNKNMLLKKQIRKDRACVVLITIIVIMYIVCRLISK